MRWMVRQIAQKFNYYTQIKTESETNPNKEKELYQQAKRSTQLNLTNGQKLTELRANRLDMTTGYGSC